HRLSRRLDDLTELEADRLDADVHALEVLSERREPFDAVQRILEEHVVRVDSGEARQVVVAQLLEGLLEPRHEVRRGPAVRKHRRTHARPVPAWRKSM